MRVAPRQFSIITRGDLEAAAIVFSSSGKSKRIAEYLDTFDADVHRTPPADVPVGHRHAGADQGQKDDQSPFAARDTACR